MIQPEGRAADVKPRIEVKRTTIAGDLTRITSILVLALILFDEHQFQSAWYYAFPPQVPDLVVQNPQGIDHDGTLTFYWIGDNCTLTVIDHNRRRTHASLDLQLDAMAGPANPEKTRSLGLSGNNMAEERTTFVSRATIHFTLQVIPGLNSFQLRVTQPTDWQVHIPGDNRKHMVRIQKLVLSPLQ